LHPDAVRRHLYSKICITFPTISVPVSFSNHAKVSGDFGLDVTLSSGEWVVDVVIQQVRAIDLGTAATLLLTAIGTAISVALLAVPFIGLLLALAVGIITAAFGIAEVTGLLASVVNVFLAGLRFEFTATPRPLPPSRPPARSTRPWTSRWRASQPRFRPATRTNWS